MQLEKTSSLPTDTSLLQMRTLTLQGVGNMTQPNPNSLVHIGPIPLRG